MYATPPIIATQMAVTAVMRMKVQESIGAEAQFAAGAAHPSPRTGDSAQPASRSIPAAARDERIVVEEVGRRVRDPVIGPVELVRAVRRVQRVADRDLVADDEDRPLGTVEHHAEAACVPARGIVEAFAPGERIAPAVRPLPGFVRLDRVALEVADIDVVEQRLLEHRHRPAGEDPVRGLPRSRETRVHAEVDRQLGELASQPLRLVPALVCQRDPHRGIAVDAARGIERRPAVPGEDEQTHASRLRDLGRKGSA